MPDSTISAAGLFFDNTFGNSYPNFGIMGCQPNYRLNIHVKNVGEYILFGLRAEDANLQFNLRKPDGTIALSGICPYSSGQTGYIRYYKQAITGPFPLAGGYSPFSYQVTNIADTGNYYFELANVPAYFNIIIDYWDFQVVSGLHSPPVPADTINGRVWSQSWQVYADLGNYVFQPFNGKFFVYSDDGIVTKLAFTNAHVGAVTIFCNPYGCLNTGNFITDRQSKNSNSYIAFPGIAQYKVFLNDPDSTVYPSGVYGQITGTPYMMDNPAFPPCSGEKQIVVSVDKAGKVEVNISFPYGGSSTNVSLYAQVVSGINQIAWNGLDGLGNQPPDGTIINVTVNYLDGLTNLPIWDQERNPNGYLISLVRPVNPTNPVPLTYWDDSQLLPSGLCYNPPQITNLTGCTPGSIPGYTGCHPWNLNLPDCHDKMINTWWFGSTSSSTFDASFNGIPDSPLGHGASRCGEGSVILHTTVLPTQTVDWYASATGGSPLLIGDTSFVTPIINSSTTYYAEARNDSNNCLNPLRTPVLATILPAPVPSITGYDSVCTGTSDNVYSTEPGMTNYTWTVSAGGAITYGQGTDAITVIWNITGAQTVSVDYTDTTGCPAVIPTILNVTVNPLPVPVISGPVSPCINTTGITYTTEAGMTGYVWTVSAGGIVINGTGTNTITVTWVIPGAQSVSVSYTDTNGCSALIPTVYEIIVNPMPVPTISGPDSTCTGTAGNIYSTEPGMTDYAWAVSAGGIITSGTGTNEITITWITKGDQVIRVNYTDTNGCAANTPVNYNVMVNPLPDPAGMINGVSPVCAGTNGVIFSVSPVSNAYTYSWTVSPGATIVAGGGTHSVVVDFAANATSGSFTVYAANLCGNGLPSPPFPVTLNQSSIAFAGEDLSTCESVPVILSSSTASNYTSILWTTSGTGIFSDPFNLHPAYTPGTDDILIGSVTLTLTSVATEPCLADTDNLILTIARQASVNAGADHTLCEGQQYVLNDANALNYSSLTWSTSGTGTFNDPQAIQTAYFPSEGDILNGKVLLTLTASSIQPCTQASDTMMLSFVKAPVVHTGPDLSVCQDISVQITGAVAQNYSSILWNHDGSGKLTGENTLTPTYSPSAGETGKVILTLKAFGNAACTDTFAASKMNITIYKPPLVDAGEDQTIEPGTSALLKGVTDGGSGSYSFKWEPATLLLDSTAGHPETVILSKDTTFTLTIHDLISGCIASDTVRIRISSKPNPPEEECIVIYNTITPNGDGANDTWIIDCIENFPDNKIVIFDRWGDKINEFENYNNTSRVWKGTNLKDDKVPDGTYYYVLTIKNGSTRTGWVFVRGGN